MQLSSLNLSIAAKDLLFVLFISLFLEKGSELAASSAILVGTFFLDGISFLDLGYLVRRFGGEDVLEKP